MDDIVDFKKLKYVLYARKSTDDPQRQVRSIDDQISECKDLAARMGLRIIGAPIIEKKSAKIPRKRKLFRQMLIDIKNKKYDAILAWNPDRLARNMMEGGEIINMVDEGVLVDMKFVTHHFSKDANGKMLLGMAFVLSKQYSDNLSQNVKRGMNRNLLEGKANNSKQGYIRDENGFQIPDDNNFELICDAWRMRREGTSLEDIADYMNGKGYAREIKSTGRLVKMDMRMLSKIFHDPFYYGILIQAGETVDLRLAYEFQPAVTQDEFFEVQTLTEKRVKPYKQKRHTYYPLKTLLSCSYCGNSMYAGASQSSKGQKYLYYRCDTKGCSRQKKSIRAKVIFEFIYSFLEDGIDFTENDYNQYYQGMTSLSEVNKNELVTTLHIKQGLLKRVAAESKDRSLKLLNIKNQPTVLKYNSERIEELDSQNEQLLKEIEQIKSKLNSPIDERLTIEQFLNLAKNAGAVVKAADHVIKDQICRMIFLNLVIDEEKVLSYQLKEPFMTLVEQRHLLNGRRDRTRTCDLTLPKRTF